MAEKRPFLSVKDIEVIYTSNKEIIHAVNGVSFDLQKGETLGLVGETGAGKTTIAKAILRILPNPPAKFLGGEIYLDGENLAEKTEDEMLKVRGDKIAMIFQDPMTALNPIMSVGDQIVEVLLLHNSTVRPRPSRRPRRCWSWWGYPVSGMWSTPISSPAA